jgi:hypothetical protein
MYYIRHKYGYNQLILCVWALLERPPAVQSLGSFREFYGTWRIITAFTRALHIYPSWARPILSTPPNLIFTRSKLMLSAHLCHGLPSGLFPSGFLTNNLHAFLFFPTRNRCPVHHILIDLIILIIHGEEYKSCSSSLSLFGSNISSAPSPQKPSVYIPPLMSEITWKQRRVLCCLSWHCTSFRQSMA